MDDGGTAAGRVACRRPSIAIALLAVLAAACGGTATTTAPTATLPGTGSATPAATATPIASSSPAPTGSEAPSAAATARESSMPATAFELTSTAIASGGEIPPRFTCDGQDTSPDLAWTGAPDGTQALALLVDDPDASGFVHWIVYDLTASDSGALPLGVSASPDAPPQGTNDFGSVGWRGPCPPSGEHRYRFRLFALAAPLRLTGAPNGRTFSTALDTAQVLGVAALEARYRRARG